MLSLDSARSAALRELGATTERVAGLVDADWSRPTRCAGWDVWALTLHVLGGARLYTDICRRMAAGIADPASLDALAPLTATPATIHTALDEQRRELAGALGALRPSAADAAFPHPWIAVSGLLGFNVVALEEGLHGSDLAAALGEPAALEADVAAAALAVAGARLPAWGRRGAAPSGELSYALAGSTARLGVRWDGETWELEAAGREAAGREAAGTEAAGVQAPRADAGCVIAGSDSAVALFVCGRVPCDHADLRVTGDRAQAERFKEFFPGP